LYFRFWVLQRYNKKTEQENRVEKSPEQSLEGIPLISIDAMAGFGKGEFQIMEYECERYVVPMFRGAEFLIQVKGSSILFFRYFRRKISLI